MNQQTGVQQASVLKMAASDMTEQNRLAHVWEIIEKVRVGMLTTQFSGGLRARPLEARVDRDAGIIWFVTDVRGAKDEEIGAAPDIGLEVAASGAEGQHGGSRAEVREGLLLHWVK